jgi:hypothetical protein
MIKSIRNNAEKINEYESQRPTELQKLGMNFIENALRKIKLKNEFFIIEKDGIWYSYKYPGGAYENLVSWNINVVNDSLYMNIIRYYINCSYEKWNILLNNPNSEHHLMVILAVSASSSGLDRKGLRIHTTKSLYRSVGKVKVCTAIPNWSKDLNLTKKQLTEILKFRRLEYEKRDITMKDMTKLIESAEQGSQLRNAK